MFRSILIALLAVTTIPSPAAAWGPIGHRTSAEIAERNMNGRTRAHVERILGGQTLREASTVPDEQRNNPDPFWQSAGPFHYVRLPRGMTADQLVQPPEGDASAALERFVATLRDPAASEQDQRRALQFVVHLVSDLHMPLHVGDEVYGGGAIPIAWFGQQQNLHWLWDEGMINLLQLSSSEYAARLDNRTTPAQVIDWWDPRPVTWMDESAALRTRVYAEMDELVPAADGEPVVLEWDYQYRWRPEMELRLQQSGYRLAAYLDWVFAEPR